MAFGIPQGDSFVREMVEAFRHRLNQEPTYICHEYAKGKRYEKQDAATSFIIDTDKMPGFIHIAPGGQLPEQIAEFHLERLDMTRYRVTKNQ